MGAAQSCNLKSAPGTVLYYFDAPGRAEAARLAFWCGGVGFQDRRIQHSEWPELKTQMPLGQVPVLETDGVKICQSVAIVRYAGERAKLYPSKVADKALCESVIVTVYECLDKLSPVFRKAIGGLYETEEEKVQEFRQTVDEQIVPVLKSMDNAIKEMSPAGFIFKKLSVADLALYAGLNNLLHTEKLGIASHFKLDQFARIKEVYEAVQQHPKVVSWNEHKKANGLN